MIDDNLKDTVAFIRKRTKLEPRLGFVLGSGLANFAANVKVEATFDFGELPGFHGATVEGHPGRLLIGTIGNLPVAVLQGRLHAYEGLPMEQVIYPVRTFAALGIKTVVLTNAAGGLRREMRPGDFMVISDHINLTGENPLRGPNWAGGPRFVDMTEAYDPKLSRVLEASFKKHRVRAHKGVYVGVMGPSYESAAEIRFFGKIGGSAVGMSTVAETIAARHAGLRVVGLSCITNLGTGLSRTKLSHAEVKDVASKVEGRLEKVLLTFVESADV